MLSSPPTKPFQQQPDTRSPLTHLSALSDSLSSLDQVLNHLTFLANTCLGNPNTTNNPQILPQLVFKLISSLLKSVMKETQTFFPNLFRMANANSSMYMMQGLSEQVGAVAMQSVRYRMTLVKTLKLSMLEA